MKHAMDKKMLADLKKLQTLDSTVEGLDGVQVHSCWTNANDSAIAEGLTPGTAEFRNAVDYHALLTARCYEIV